VIVVDASAIVAMLTREPEAVALVSALAAADRAETTPIAIYEAVLGLSRKRQWSVAEAETHVGDFLRAAGVAIHPIRPETTHVALEAFARYGKGRGHPPASTSVTVLRTLRQRFPGQRSCPKAKISRRQISRARPERPPLLVHPHLTGGLGVSISRRQTAKGNWGCVAGSQRKFPE
jgi:ribonuclease VapC